MTMCSTSAAGPGNRRATPRGPPRRARPRRRRLRAGARARPPARRRRGARQRGLRARRRPGAPLRPRPLRRRHQPVRNDVLLRPGGRLQQHRARTARGRPAGGARLAEPPAQRVGDGDRHRTLAVRAEPPSPATTDDAFSLGRPRRHRAASSSAPASAASASAMSTNLSSTGATSTRRWSSSRSFGARATRSPACRPAGARALERLRATIAAHETARGRRRVRLARLADHRPPPLTTV